MKAIILALLAIVTALIGMSYMAYTTPEILVARSENPYTCQMANRRVKEIQKDFSHTKFRTDIKRPAEYQSIGENLAKGYKTKTDMYQAWFKSPKHNKILQSKWDYSCLRCKNSFCVEFFAKRM